MTQLPHRFAQLADGTVTILINAPRQVYRTWKTLSPEQRRYFMKRVGLGEVREDSLTKALPFIATAIVGIVAWNIIRSRNGR